MTALWQNRRSFMAKAAAIGAVAVGSAKLADDAMAKGAGLTVSASTENQCATCDFWGGARHISADKKNVTAMGPGFCNNPKSPMYQKKTPPDHKMNETWTKWGALKA